MAEVKGKWKTRKFYHFTPDLNWYSPEKYDYYSVENNYNTKEPDWQKQNIKICSVFFFKDEQVTNSKIDNVNRHINEGNGKWQSGTLRFRGMSVTDSTNRCVETNNPRLYCGMWEQVKSDTQSKGYKWFTEVVKFTGDWNEITCPDIPRPQPQPPTPDGGDGQSNGGQAASTSCSNTGQFGGGGTPLKDIKLFLYANNVTKGTIKLSKPQVEVGTFATDWRPNPSDYVHVNNSNFKRINGIAMQHSDDNGKNYLEIQTKDGHVFGIDTWGGTQKLLEQQQAEIEELKKLIQTLETKINV